MNWLFVANDKKTNRPPIKKKKKKVWAYFQRNTRSSHERFTLKHLRLHWSWEGMLTYCWRPLWKQSKNQDRVPPEVSSKSDKRPHLLLSQCALLAVHFIAQSLRGSALSRKVTGFKLLCNSSSSLQEFSANILWPYVYRKSWFSSCYSTIKEASKTNVHGLRRRERAKTSVRNLNLGLMLEESEEVKTSCPFWYKSGTQSLP